MLIFFAAVSSCASQGFKGHFGKSRTGFSKAQILKRFGPPNQTFEDSHYFFYIYRLRSAGKNPRLWNIKYKFLNNALVVVTKELIPTPEELDRLDPRKSKIPLQYKQL